MRIKQLFLAVGFTLLAASSTFAQGIDCPDTTLRQCIVSRMMAAIEEYDEPKEQQRYVAGVVRQLIWNELHEEAIGLLKTHGETLGRSDLRFFAKDLAENGFFEDAKWTFNLAVHVTEVGRLGARHSALDLLTLAEMQFEQGFSEDTRETLRRAAELARQISDPAQAVYEMEATAIRQRLYGWPEDVGSTLKGSVELAQTIERDQTRAFKIGSVGKEYYLSGFDDLGDRAFATMEAVFSGDTISDYDKAQMISALISDHAQAGRLETAYDLSQKYEFSVGQYQSALYSAANILASSEEGYLPKFMPSSVERLAWIASQLTDVNEAGTAYGWLISRLLREGQFDEALSFLPKIEGTQPHSEAVYDIVGHIARDADDPIRAEEILLRERPTGELSPYHSGNNSVRYPLSLVGQGFADLGMHERALPYLQRALDMYIEDTDTRKSLPWGVFHRFALAGHGNEMFEMLGIAETSEDRFELIQAIALGALKGGHLDVADDAIISLQLLVESLPDEPDEQMKAFMPDATNLPTPRSIALGKLSRIYSQMATHFLEEGEYGEARDILRRVDLQADTSNAYVKLALALSHDEPSFTAIVLTDVLSAADQATSPQDRVSFYASLLRNLN
jgi:tetratricopeptide (TPR) repeat protein